MAENGNGNGKTMPSVNGNGKSIPNMNYFLVGLGIGSVVAILFAPKSGQETRQYIADKTKEANEYTRQKAHELRIRAEDAVERGKGTIAQTKEQIATAIEAGRETYERERSKVHVS
jgi:gas vesicle protein